MILLNKIQEHLDGLLHPSARSDAMTSARHKAFIAPRLLGSLVALALMPIYLVLRGAPSEIEVAILAWLVTPILIAYFLSRTGRYESAHVLSSIALVAMAMAIAIPTGGVTSLAAAWLVVVPIEASLSASRRVVVLAATLALAGVASLTLLALFGLPAAVRATPRIDLVFAAFALGSATLFASILAFAAESLSRASGGLLLAEEERYRMLALNMSDIVSRHRRNGAIEFISPAAEAVLGVAVARLTGHGLFDRVHVGDRPAYLKALSDAARGADCGGVEFRVRREAPQAGVDFAWLEMRCRPLDAASGDASGNVVAVMRDVTTRKVQEEALRSARVAAERADASKSRFLATMSHELRTPLNAIIGFSEMIVREDDLMIDAERRKEYAQLINDSGQHLLSVVNGILDLSKLEAGSFELALEKFVPRDALLSCCNLMALKARDSSIELRTRLPETLPEMTADPRALRQVVLNLVSNAIKFTEAGGTVTVSCRVEGGQLVLSVADTGIGIGSDDLKRIGEPFFQAETSYQRRHEGTGLGLSIVKNLVALHGGQVSVSSRVNEGTIVNAVFPLVATPPQLKLASNVTTLAAAPRPDNSMLQVKKSA